MAGVFNVFPRNPDGSLKTKEPCQTPGCSHPNWHICLDPDDPVHKEVQPIKTKERMSDAQRKAISESQRRRWAKIKAAENDLYFVS